MIHYSLISKVHASIMSTTALILTILLLLHTPFIATVTTTPYFFQTTLFSDYQHMVSNFKIFIYPPPQNNNNLTETLTPPLSLFYNALLTSEFLTRNPNQANLFFLPFPPQSTRSLARYIQTIRTSYPHWDRSLGADHFYLSCTGVGPSSSRNVVELRKNAVQVSCIPSPAGEFIPHKDVSLPPQPLLTTLLPPRAEIEDMPSTRFLGYWRFDQAPSSSGMVSGLTNDPEFLIESQPSVYLDIKRSKFCLFVYEEGVVGLGEALAQGCVPVIITDRPIQDLPLMDVIKWSEIALFVGSSVGPEELKRVLHRTCESGGLYERMSELGVAAAHHFVWNEEEYDAFHMVMYQLWRRRHATRYARWEEAAA